MKQPPALEAGEARGKGECNLARGTRGEVHSQPAFEVAHLAAGGTLFCRDGCMNNKGAKNDDVQR